LFSNEYIDKQIAKSLYELASNPANKSLIVDLFIYLFKSQDFGKTTRKLTGNLIDWYLLTPQATENLSWIFVTQALRDQQYTLPGIHWLV
jgi:hypothetical protein